MTSLKNYSSSLKNDLHNSCERRKNCANGDACSKHDTTSIEHADKTCDKQPSTVFCADIGTSSLKAALISKTGQIIAFSQQTFYLDNQEKNKNFFPAQKWLDALEKASLDFKDKIKSVCAICISGNGPTLVSETGVTLLWNDTIDSEILQTKTKSIFIPRILGFKQKYAKEWKKTKTIFSGPEYVLYKLTGIAITILPEKRYKTAYWQKEELLKFGITNEEAKKLPKFCTPAENLGCIKDDFAKKLNVNNSVKVFAGVPDFVAALIGTNTLSKGKICNRAGSSEGINFCTEKPLTDEKVRTLPSIIPNLWNASVLLTSSGKYFAEYKQKLERQQNKSISYKELTNFCLQNTSSEGFKIMSSLATNVSEAITLLKTLAKKNNLPFENKVFITGGQAKTESWVQMKADISKTPFYKVSTCDAELLGDAILAYVGLGEYKSLKDAADSMVKPTEIFYPKN